MKRIKKILRKLDLSGLPFTFKYKSKEKYSTALGGFILILFSLVALYFGIYYLLEFINKKNFTIIYYTATISEAEIVKFKDSKVNVGFGLDCPSKGKYQAEDLFQIEAKFINFTKNNEGLYNKDVTILPTHFCNHSDFFNEHNDSFDRLSADKYLCLDDSNHELVGIFSDKIFTYYELSVKSKDNTAENINNIEEFLFETDCKLEIALIEKAVDLDNYNEPITSYLNELFIQLNPILFIKRNMFFMNQYLDNDDDLFGLFNGEKNSSITCIHSRYEEYSLYLGLNRSITKPPDYLSYGKVYFRADTKKTEIRRIYQNLFEFYANISSLLIAVFKVLVFLLNFFNNYYAEVSFSNKIFIFKDFENKNFNINKKLNQINKIKSLLNTCNLNDTTENSSFFSDIDCPNEKVFGNYELFTYNKCRRIYDCYDYNNKEIKSKSISYSGKGIENIIKDFNYTKIKNRRRSQIYNEKMELKYSIDSKNNTNNNYFSTNKIFANSNITNDKNNNVLNKLNDIVKKNDNIIYNINKYDLNLCEIIILCFCKCGCFTSKLKLKNKYYEKIKNIINKNLDIVFYIRNTLLFYNMNEILLNTNNKNIINFLYRPILTTNNTKEIEEKKINELNQDYKEIYFDKFYNQFSELLQKTNLTDREKK